MHLLIIFTITSFAFATSSSCLSIIEKDLSLDPSPLKYSGKGLNELGKYDTCLRQGMQYKLLANIDPNNSFQVRIGICLPISCNIPEINEQLLKKSFFLLSIPENNLTNSGLIFLLIFLIIIATTIISTILHCYSPKFSSYKLVKCFTAVDTMQTLLKIRANNKFGCINGLKVLSFAWVIYGHCISMKLASSVINLENIQDLTQHWWGTLAIGGFYSVDIFFFISGLLLSYFLLEELEKTQGKIRLGPMYLHRILRILPTFAFVLGFYYFILPSLSEGPMWDNVRLNSVAACEEYWWTNFLFINNFVPDWKGNDCFGIGWYLANDMQFFIVGPLLVFLHFSVKNKSAVWGFFAFLILFCMVISYYTAYDLNLRMNVADKLNSEGNWYQWFYIKPYIRFIPYLQGIMTGVIYKYYDKVLEKREIIGKDTVSGSIVWLVTRKRYVSIVMTVFGVILMYYFVVFQQPLYDDIWNSSVWSRNTNAIALAVSRFGFILGLILFILPVMMNKASFINNFLGNSVFEPIAKISYCGFLAQFAILLSFFSSQNNTLIGGIYLAREFFTIFPITLLVGLFIYICAEIPFQNIEKQIFNQKISS